MADRILRCAVYTRKSTEDGLDQEFNSLDAQYEACAAYAVSQRHEGWILVKDRYDDGGYSGGNMNRPGLKQLLADVAAGKVDIILLYKIDRLTRSLADFAKIVEVLDKAEASFVSITQSFNTTTSMGRLTLNMLLSFAQFEREVTGERIRDKIAASKKKGIWMGGPVPLGYVVNDRKLLPHKSEAAQVRHIMERYLVLGNVPALAEELNKQGYRTKVQRRTSGPHRGGCMYRRGTLFHMLTNRIYRGMIVHKDKAYPGEHEAIVDKGLWDRVQAQLASNASGPSHRRKVKDPSLLIGLLCDGEGRAMTPSHTSKKTRRYRYYVTRPDQIDATPAWRVSAPDLEKLICEQLASRLATAGFILDLVGDQDIDATALQQAADKADLKAAELRNGKAEQKIAILHAMIARIDLHEERIEVILGRVRLLATLGIDVTPDPTEEEIPTLVIPAVRVRRGHQLRLIIPGPEHDTPPARRDQRLIKLVADALEARELVLTHPDTSMAALAAEHGRCRTRLSKLVALSCLAPDIVQRIVEGRQPETLTSRSIMAQPLPDDWAEQRKLLGVR